MAPTPTHPHITRKHDQNQVEPQFEEDTEAEIAAMNAAAAAAMGASCARLTRLVHVIGLPAHRPDPSSPFFLPSSLSTDALNPPTPSNRHTDNPTHTGGGADFEDPAKAVDMRVVKKKTFDMPPMSVQDAVVCLD